PARSKPANAKPLTLRVKPAKLKRSPLQRPWPLSRQQLKPQQQPLPPLKAKTRANKTSFGPLSGGPQTSFNPAPFSAPGFLLREKIHVKPWLVSGSCHPLTRRGHFRLYPAPRL